ncbi:hypothetical protein PVAND_008408 [Polypedilum vanderplanki]|uniref:Uncharacterized protein n=1 Tax=Polypedilum vanderplanki TaxID=319348 RepID=A0A9J6C9E5_POLVA|nr:hypothetical protein PVAND_008408 [Polypedilum vanderplanki]
MSEYRKEVSKVVYNDRYGYAIAFYPPPHMRDTKLEILERSKKINLPSVRPKCKPEPTRVWKLRETPSDFLKRKNIEREIEVLHDTCQKAKDLFRKARDLDYNRNEMLYPSYKNSTHSRNVNDVIHDVEKIYETCLMPKKKEDEKESKPKSVISDIHESCEHKISKRRQDAIHEIQVYCDSIDKLYKRIEDLSNAFKEEKEEQEIVL